MFHVANGKYHSRIKLVRAIKLLWPKKPPRQGDETTQMTLSRTGTLRPPAQQTLSFKPAAAAPSSAAAAAETHVKPEEAIPAWPEGARVKEESKPTPANLEGSCSSSTVPDICQTARRSRRSRQ